jgi:hypothetical protein
MCGGLKKGRFLGPIFGAGEAACRQAVALEVVAKPFFVFAKMLYVHFVPVGDHLAIAFLFQD